MQRKVITKPILFCFVETHFGELWLRMAEKKKGCRRPSITVADLW